MQLIADRFAVGDNGDAIDLATGERVLIVMGTAGGVTDERRWSERCERLQAIVHRSVAPLVDFGLVGESSRFEAWGCGAVWRGSPDEADAVRMRATRFLRAMCLSIGDVAGHQIRTSRDGTGAWVPDAGSGYPHGERGPDQVPLADRGVRLIRRPAVDALAEMFQDASGPRSHVAALWGVSGSGRRTAARQLARIGRMNGFVPIASHLLESTYADLCRGRSLFIVSVAEGRAPWGTLLQATLRAAQPHVLLIAGGEEVRAVDGVALRSVSTETLVASICPGVVGTSLEAAVRRAAERAHGVPGRFANTLWPRAARPRDDIRASARRRRREAPAVAAEQPLVYGSDDEAHLDGAPPIASATWPAPGELAALRRKLEAGKAQLAAGRYVPGMRELRSAVSGLARRGAWSDAAGGAVAIASAALRRGRPRDVHTVIDEAREYTGRAGDDLRLVDLAVLSGEASIDLVRLDDAEGILATALTTARAAQDATRIAAAGVTLSRCLFWRGRYVEAASCLTPLPDAAPWPLQVRHAIAVAKIAAARREFSDAMMHVTAARQHAQSSTSALLQGDASYAAAFVRLAVGDLDAAEHDLSATIALARAAHDPMRALRARLLRAETIRRRGRKADAVASLHRLARATALAPPLVRARAQLLSGVLAADRDGEASASRSRAVASTGLGALSLYVATPAASEGLEAAAEPFVDHLVAILRVCQNADEDSVVLKHVCTRVREHLHAAGVAVVAIRDGRARSLASDGGRLEADIAERAARAGIAIAPHRHDDRIEAAVPVVYGGSAIAAICARWTIGSSYDTSRAAPILTTTAAAAAPIVAAAIARAEQPAPSCGSELLGVSPAIVELRRSVESAAAAPFAVHIDGESGSGKELVARAIHRGSGRRHKPFCTLNCAALPDDLVESELFGHSRGAFTGAVAERAGVFEEAHGGTLFLDEVGELSPRAQAKLLRVIQEGELRRLGETLSRRVDVRIVSATNRDLKGEVEAGRFRLDLSYRLDVVHITVPRLRDRREDVAVLAEHFWRDAAARVGSRATLGADTLAALARYDWPGNVRELQNVLAALAVRSQKRGVVRPSALPPVFGDGVRVDAWRLDEARRTFEERFVRAALVRTGGHRGRAAAELGVTRQGLTKLLTRLGIN